MVELESLKQTVDRLTARLWPRSSGRRTWAGRIAGGGPLCHFNATTVWAGGRPQLLLVLRNRNGESMACQGGMFHGTQRRVGDGTVRPWWDGALALPRIPWAPCHLPVAHWPLPGCGYVPWGSVQFGHNAHGGCCSSRRRSNLGQWPAAFGAYTRSCERTMVLPCPGGLVCCLGMALEPLDILDRNIYQVRPRHRIAALLPSAAAACPILAACLLWLPDVSLSLPSGSAAGDPGCCRSDHGQRAILHGPIPAPRAGDGCPDLGGLMRSLGFALGLVPRKRLPETGHGPAWRPCCRLCRTDACPGWTPARSGRLVSPGYVRRPLGGFNLDTIPIGCR